MKLLCLFGFHSWREFMGNMYKRMRTCNHCGKVQYTLAYPKKWINTGSYK